MPNTFKLFVYGTLKTGQGNHHYLKDHTLNVQNAVIGPARLWSFGCPFLELAPTIETVKGVPKKFTRPNWPSKTKTSRNELDQKLYNANMNLHTPTDQPWRFIEGELFTLPTDKRLLCSLDSLEGFTSDFPIYQRSQVMVFLPDNTATAAWVYHIKDLDFISLDYYPYDIWDGRNLKCTYNI
jgi:gamma-glutamylcyclotransferase (GGCT)/AIG2-like uncharacterized protein YtfP